MQIRLLASVAAAALVGTAVYAQHLAVPLSHPLGEETLDRVVFYAEGAAGVPNYRLGTDHEDFEIPGGAWFDVTDHHGTTQTVAFSSHADDHLTTFAGVIDEINDQLTIARAEVVNETLVLRGMEGGLGASLALVDGAGAPLAALGLPAALGTGRDDIEVTLSIPAEDEHGEGDHHAGPGLAHHPYVLVASTTDGVTSVGDVELPIGLDATVTNTLRATTAGLLPGFAGELDENEDAVAVLPRATLRAMFPHALPSELYLAYVVLGAGPEFEIEYVSNRFTVEIVD